MLCCNQSASKGIHESCEEVEELAAPPQGEMNFAKIAHDERYAIAEPLANLGDSQAMQSVGLLLYSGVGGGTATHG